MLSQLDSLVSALAAIMVLSESALFSFSIDSFIVSKYPNSHTYPKFYNLGETLKRMFEGEVKIHPHTREMLSSLDQ